MPVQTTNIDVPTGPALVFKGGKLSWTIAPDVVVHADGGISSVFGNFANSSLVNAGVVVAIAGDGVLFNGGQAVVANLARGSIYGGSVGVHLAGADGKVQNAGLIQSGFAGVQFDAGSDVLDNAGVIQTVTTGVLMSAGGGRVINSGEISAESEGLRVVGAGDFQLNNSGRISAQSVLAASGASGNLKLVNTGVLDGLVLSGSGFDVVVNKGLVTDSIILGDGGSTYDGRDALGSVTVTGGAGSDRFTGGAGDDVFRGGDDSDQLSGRGGDDELIGQRGSDFLVGGAGADNFRYIEVADSTRQDGDTIADFSSKDGDVIDLSIIDANANKPGSQFFTWLGAGDFTKTAGELHYVDFGRDVLVEGDVNGDGRPDLVILLLDVQALSEGDFVL